MEPSDEATKFDVIEDHKENIQSLPGGRSARMLAQVLSPTPLGRLSTPTPTDARNVNECIRAEYEAEIETIAESDDPLDVYDRYVRWTLDAYPSAQATPESQLHTLLERATKSFVKSSQYKSDPRYLRLWMYYIRFFSDSPRETYMFLSRHGIGETLALFYEEYAAWLEEAGRWSQAEEVYKLGIEKGARPMQRLSRKFKEFEQRLAQVPEGADEPSSPALPSLRPALAAKTDPFGAASFSADPQASRPSSGVGGASSKPKSKLAIFSDVDAKPSAVSSRDTASKGWDSIGSLADRKKENGMEPRPWAGEILKGVGKKPASAAKMSVFRDPSLSQIQNIVVVPSKHQVTTHPQTGKREYIYVNLADIYPTPEEAGTELSFEEIIASSRGWLDRAWDEEMVDDNFAGASADGQDTTLYDENGARKGLGREASTARKKRLMEVNETQIIKAKLDSPSRPKMRKKHTSEPTMTLHTRAATDDIYDIFNAPLKPASHDDDRESGNDDDDGDDDDDDDDDNDDDYESDGDYSSGGESTGTTKHVDPSEHDEQADVKSMRGWSDSSVSKPITEEKEDGGGSGGGGREGGHVLTAGHAKGGSKCAAADREASSLPRSRTTFIPIPPEDYEPPTRPYRDPAEMANNRLPFMTPITERTECSLDVDPELPAYKTPCRQAGMVTAIDEEESDLEPLSSPLRDILTEELSFATMAMSLQRGGMSRASLDSGPVIRERQCSPVDNGIRFEIIARLRPALKLYPGFYDHRPERCAYGSEIRRFSKALMKNGRNGDKAGPIPSPVAIEFEDCASRYMVKRELGAGAFAPVYLVERVAGEERIGGERGWEQEGEPDGGKGGEDNSEHARSGRMEALKMESPPTPWEFYMMRVAHSRLGPHERAAQSLSHAHEMHLFADEAFLFLPFHPHGTLLDVINLFRSEACGVMDEQLVVFFSVELLRTVEALHGCGVLHGDLKPDNCLLRLDGADALPPPSSQWQADGSGGWAMRGVTLIDFGRGIDMRAFVPDVEFVADWKPSMQDCPEMREGRPWTWQIDYYGLAGIIHCLLFGKYIETVQVQVGGLGGEGCRYRIRESFKRYWQTDIWSDCFNVLLNPASYVGGGEDGRMPVLRSMRNVRERMEAWLEMNCEKGVGLKALIGKVEAFARSRK